VEECQEYPLVPCVSFDTRKIFNEYFLISIRLHLVPTIGVRNISEALRHRHFPDRQTSVPLLYSYRILVSHGAALYLDTICADFMPFLAVFPPAR